MKKQTAQFPPFKPHTDNLPVAVEAEREDEIKRDFLKVLPKQYWPEFRRACSEAYQTHIARKENSVKESKKQIYALATYARKIKRLLESPTALTQSLLEPSVLLCSPPLLDSILQSEQLAKKLPGGTASKSYRNQLAFKVACMLQKAGVPIKIARSLTTRGNGNGYYQLMVCAMKMAEGDVPQNLRTHMELGKTKCEELARKKVAKSGT